MMEVEHSSALFRKARQGSPTAISAIFERYGRRLHGLIRLRLGPHLRRRLESRDILQATLLKAFQGIERFDGSGSRSLMAWLGTIAHAEICDQADFYKRHKRNAARDTSLDRKVERIAEEVRSETSRLQLEADTDFYKRHKRNAARDTSLDRKVERTAEEVRSETSRLQLEADSERLERAIDALSDAHREVVLLRNFEELGFREIGERLGKSPDACRMSYARALAALALKTRELR